MGSRLMRGVVVLLLLLVISPARSANVFADSSPHWVSTTLQSAVVSNGNGGMLGVNGMATAAFTVTIAGVATVNFEGSEDGSTWTALQATQIGTTITSNVAATSGVYLTNVAGLQAVRSRISGWSSGAVTVTAHAVPIGGGPSSGGSGGAVTAANGAFVAGSIVDLTTLLSRFPAATALTDAWANPTVSEMQSFLMGWNGTTWDRLKVDTSKNLMVSLGTQLDATNDSVNVGKINAITPVMDATYGLGADIKRMVALPAGTNFIGSTGGNTVSVTATFTRPANTTAYSALQTVANSVAAPTILTFTNAARVNGGSGYIVRASVKTDQSTNTARYRLHFYTSATPHTLINDGAAYTQLWTDQAATVATYDVPALSTEGAGSTMAMGTNLLDRVAFVTGADRNLYAEIETLDAFTPASAQNYAVTIVLEDN